MAERLTLSVVSVVMTALGNRDSCPGAGHTAQAQVLLFSFYFYLFILVLATLGLCCRSWAFFSCSEWGLLLVLVQWLLTMLSLVAEHKLQASGLQ